MLANPPDGYHTVTPQSIVPEPAEVLEFAKEVFAATVHDEFVVDDVIIHAEFQLGDSRMMVGASNEQLPAYPASTHVYVEDVDAIYERALAHGAESIRGPEDQFFGDRTAVVRDSQGNRWTIATRIEDVTIEEMHRRMDEMSG